MDLNSAKVVMKRLEVVKSKIESLPFNLRDDLKLECMLIEDKVRDMFYRRVK